MVNELQKSIFLQSCLTKKIPIALHNGTKKQGKLTNMHCAVIESNHLITQEEKSDASTIDATPNPETVKALAQP